MSLLKWKEMAEKRSELGQRINAVRETMKQKSISDQMGQVEAAKLFEPITSRLSDIAAPKLPLRRLLHKNKQVPDYGLEIGDDEEVPDYGLEDLFGEEVKPQNDKQLVPKPPSYEDILEDLASGEKSLYVEPEYMYEPEDLPAEYEEEEEVSDYTIIEEDRINQALDNLNIPNYNDVDLRLKEDEMDDKKTKSYLRNVIKKADEQRKKIPGYSSQITKKLKKGFLSEAEAQYQRKTIEDIRKVLNDYIEHNRQKLKNIKGSGFRKNKRGGQIMFFDNPTEMIKRLNLIVGSMAAGNNNIELRNTGVTILDILLRKSILNRSQYNKIYKNYFSLN